MATKQLSKSQIISQFAEKLEIPKKDAATYFDELAAVTAKEVKRAGVFVLPGIGKVVLARRKERMGRNPQTGEPIKIPAKTVLKIRVAKALKDAVLPKK